ncbi:factor-independent urate hydroxylase [Hymenobacter sp. PAMC 26628]|uniref:factor-independent urate hydroxylase n=1 Tax=Hymenobacter sp. PAMC 26628 TaxID=1484118 RepID=UPI0007706514|nr:urate oxidase [Hymenobacter sp. PAMC 26628]AMJ64724.1 urate oxidase [Hymenobacter sp. PAMC 26628]
MPIKLAANAYGKNAVNLSRVIRHAGHHEFRQVSVSVQLTGDFETAHTLGDNALILPTDTQKNTVYALAKEHFTGPIEAFGLVLARHFVSRNPQVHQARIEIVEHLYQRMVFDGHSHPHAFTGGSEKRRAVVVLRAGGAPPTVYAGLKGLLLLKTAGSGFVGYPKDEFTVLPETTDRILATECEAEWEYTTADLDFEAQYQQIRTNLLRTFAGHHSLSVQHTLFAIGENILKENELVKEISLVMPNKHHVPFNLEPFGQANTNEVFVATDAPFGYITGTVVRE